MLVCSKADYRNPQLALNSQSKPQIINLKIFLQKACLDQCSSLL